MPPRLEPGAWSPDVHRRLQDLIDATPPVPAPVAVLDWDDTMLEGDSSLTLLRAVDAREGTRWHDRYFELLAEHGRVVAYPQITKWFAGRTEAAFRALCTEVVAAARARGRIPLRPEMADLARVLAAAGWDLWVVTASPTLLVQTMVGQVGIAEDHVLGMRLEVDADGRMTDRVIPPETWGQGKADAIRRFVPRTPQLVAGDSSSDAPMLALAEVPLLLDGHDVALRARARAEGWLIQGGWRHTEAEPGVQVGP